MPRKKRDEAEIAATISELPTKPPEGIIETMEKRGLIKGDALLYRAGSCYIPLEDRVKKMALVHCTACGEETYLEHVAFESGCWRGASDTFGFIDPADGEAKHSYSSCICPQCGKGMSAVHISRFRSSYQLDRHFISTAHNVRGHLCLLSWSIAKYTDKDGNISYSRNMWEGVVIVGGTLTRVCGYTRFMSSVSWNIKWEARKRGEDMIGACDPDELEGYTRELVESTDSAHSALYEYIEANGNGKIYPGAYMQLWCKYPNVENLVRAECGRYVGELICRGEERNGSYYSAEKLKTSVIAEYVNWREVKPHRMLDLEKNELQLAIARKVEIVDYYKHIKDTQGIKLDSLSLDRLETFGVYNTNELITRYKVPIIRTLGYLARQRERLGENTARGSLISPRYLGDYWRAVEQVYGGLDKSLQWPRDLVSAHDNMVAHVKEKEEETINAKIRERLEELELRSYRSEELGMLIRPAASQGELIAEGKTLHHCVGSYANSHADGATSIYFIRRIDAPDVPFYTLEYKGGKVAQNRGDHNCAETIEVIAFKEEWLRYLQTLKETKNNAKRRKAHV